MRRTTDVKLTCSLAVPPAKTCLSENHFPYANFFLRAFKQILRKFSTKIVLCSNQFAEQLTGVGAKFPRKSNGGGPLRRSSRVRDTIVNISPVCFCYLRRQSIHLDVRGRPLVVLLARMPSGGDVKAVGHHYQRRNDSQLCSGAKRKYRSLVFIRGGIICRSDG